jgi:predicted nucleic acid-binding protein
VIVVDANVAIKWVIDQPLRDRAREIVARRISVVAPSMFVAETATALWKYVRAGEIDEHQARQGLSLVLGQISLFEQDAILADEALQIGLQLNYAPYDCFYLVLAMQRGVPLVTVDQRFINRIAQTTYKSRVVHLSDWT